MSKTKQKILEKALEMFNEQGTEVVTTRHVAAALKMSQGNLHYHYPNKNALIQALYEVLLQRIAQSQRYSGNRIGLEDVLLSMIDHFELMHQYRFFFLDREQVWRRIPRLEREARVFIWRTRRRMRMLIHALQGMGVMRRDFSSAQIDAFVDVQVILINSWLNAASLIHPYGNPNVWEAFALRMFRTWLPYLEPMHLAEWEERLSVEFEP